MSAADTLSFDYCSFDVDAARSASGTCRRERRVRLANGAFDAAVDARTRGGDRAWRHAAYCRMNHCHSHRCEVETEKPAADCECLATAIAADSCDYKHKIKEKKMFKYNF